MHQLQPQNRILMQESNALHLLRVTYYEQLLPNETIIGERYQQQLMQVSRTLKLKRPPLRLSARQR